MKTTLTYLLGVGCLAAAAPTNTTATADSPAAAVNGTSTLNSTGTNTTKLDAPTNAKVWMVPATKADITLNEVVATWDAVPGAAKYRFCHDEPAYRKRCTVVTENKYNLGFTLDSDYIDEEKRKKVLWSVRAEGAGGAANGTSVSEWATVQLQSNNTALAQGATLHCSKEKLAANDNEFKWEVTAEVKEPAEGLNTTSATIDATWSVGQTTGDKFTLPEGSMYEVCVHTEGFNDAETDQWTEECALYPNTTTLTNVVATNISKTAFQSTLTLSVTNLCTRAPRDQGLSEPFTLRRLSSQFNFTELGLCISAEAEGTGFAPPKAAKCTANTTARFDYVNSLSAEGGFRLKLVVPGEENGFGEGSRRQCLTVSDESKLEYKVCSEDDKKSQSWVQEKIMVSPEGGSGRGISIYCILSVANRKNALVVEKEGGALKVGDCAKNRASWEQGGIN